MQLVQTAKAIFTSTTLAFITGCAPVTYHTIYEGGHDPIYEIKKVKTIGFTPLCWTTWRQDMGFDELAEKRLFVYARNELQKRGYEVTYIYPEDLVEDTAKHAVYVRDSYSKMPDLTLTLGYWQALGNTVRVPGETVGFANWGNTSGNAYYGQTQSYDVQTYYLALNYTLWSGSPKYINKVWEGTIKKGSPKPDLFDQAPSMASSIFYRKFDQ